MPTFPKGNLANPEKFRWPQGVGPRAIIRASSVIVRLEISTRRRDGARYGIGPVDRARHVHAAMEHEGWAKERKGGTGKVSEGGRGSGRGGKLFRGEGQIRRVQEKRREGKKLWLCK